MANNRYCVDLAKRGVAGCKNCNSKIEKGVVRIAKIIPNPFTDSGGDMKQWFHVRCIFDKLSRARATTKKIETTDDLEGWDELSDEHKNEVLKHFSENATSSSTKKTPQKAAGKASVSQISDEQSSSSKDDTLREFRKLVSKISDEPSYLEKTAIVSKFFSEGSDGSGFKGNLYLWVKLLLPNVDKRVYNLQNKQLVKLFSEIFSASQEEMLEDLEKGDVAETVANFFENSDSFPPEKKSTLTLQEVDKFLDNLTKVSREFEQSQVMKKIAKRCTANDLKMFIRFIKHDLRMNAGPKPILSAIHPTAYEAFQASRNLEDIITRSLQEKKGGKMKNQLTVQANLMTPVLPMLAMACGSVPDVFKRCPNGFYVEIKYDGERVQLHKKGNEFIYFSRSLKPVMPYKVSHFKDFIPKAFPHGNDLMLDCEILLVSNDGKPLPFGTLGAHKKTAFKDATVCLFVFDCLQFNGENLMNKPLVERRKVLQDNMTPIKNHIMFSEMKEINSPVELKDIIDSVIDQGLEGIVVKDKLSIYEPGKRHWLKIKKDYMKGTMVDSADLVVLGAYYGTGKNGHMMSIFLMGCYNENTGKWCTVTKVHGGFKDAELLKLQDDLKMEKISKDPSRVPSWLNINQSVIPDFVSVDPEESPVWEITGAEFSKAEIHTASGISIRFPRVTRVRNDKTWKEATTLRELRQLYENSKETIELIGLATVKKDDDEDIKSNKTIGKSKGMPKSFTEESASIKLEATARNSPEKRKKNPVNNTPKMLKHDAQPAVKEEHSKTTQPSKANKLPNLFTGVKLVIPKQMKNADMLRKYFIAYDGVLLEEHEKDEANHVIYSEDQVDQNIPRNVTIVTADWLWDSIKLQKKLATNMYKPQSTS